MYMSTAYTYMQNTRACYYCIFMVFVGYTGLAMHGWRGLLWAVARRASRHPPVHDDYFLLQVARPRNGLERNLLRPMLPGSQSIMIASIFFHVPVEKLCIILVVSEK